MPIRRLFGLLVSVLCLLSAPAAAQTVAFVHGGTSVPLEENEVYVDETEARVRVTDPAADASSTAMDMVSVTVTTALSGDSEVVDLWETYRDSGVFEGRIRLVRNATPSQAGVLETGFAAGPPPVYETLTAQYGAATATAAVAPVRIQILDEHGRPATALTHGDWVHVRLEDHVRADDPWMRDAVSVLVQNPDMADVEPLTLTETALRTGVFEGRIRHLAILGQSGDGVVGGYPFHQILAAYDVPGYPEDAEASAIVVGSRVETLGADGRPASLVPESSPLRLRVTNRAAAENPGVETVEVELHSQITGDDETVVLTETGPATGIFEGTVPTTVFGTAQDDDGTLTTGELLGPPHSFDVVQISYTDDIGFSGTVWTSVGTYASETRFTDAEGNDTESYAAGFPVWVRVEDHNANQPSVVDTIQATVQSLAQGDSEALLLTETGQDTAVFSGSMQLAADPGTAGDGILQGQLDDTLRVLHGDALGMTASGDLARLRGNSLQFIDADGRAVGEVLENGTARVRVEMAVCNGSPSSIDTCPLVLTTRIHGDAESLSLLETGENTGVFVGEIPTPFAFFEIPYNGALEIGSSGSPEYLPDVVTASAGSEFASVPTAPFRLSFVHADGGDAPTFETGEAVGLRLEDHSGNDPQILQAETLQVHLIASTEAEPVTLTETGYDTGVYVGSVPSQLSASPALNSGTLDVEIGSRLRVERSSATDLREVRDEAVMGGATVAPDSPVRFVDEYGIPTDSYVAGSTAYMRVEDAAANLLPSAYDTVQVTVSAPASGDSETANLRETARDSGIFEGSVPLSALQAGPGDLITAAYAGGSDQATIRYAAAMFVDEAGVPTGEVLESGVARLRVVGTSGGETIGATLRSQEGADVENVTLAETFPGSQVYEGTMQLAFGPRGNGTPQNGVLETSNSGASAYRGDTLTLEYQDGEGTAVTVPSRVRFFDGFGRVTATFAVGERIGVRVEDHNLDNPFYKEQIQVLVREAGLAYSQPLDLVETGYDTNVYEGAFAGGVLPVQPGQAIEAERLNENTPNPTVARATIAGASVIFLDAQGRPGALFFERTRAWVRVIDQYADLGSSIDMVTVSLSSALALDSESLTLFETGGSTGMFEGSIPLTTGGSNPNNGYLETGQYAGPPHEFDTLTASYASANGTATATAGTIGSRTWFLDARGNETDGYTAGTTAYVRVEDHVANAMPDQYDIAQVTLSAPETGDSETVSLRETARDSGIFEGSVRLEKEDYPPVPNPGDGRLQSMPGEEIEAVHDDWGDGSSSSDRAVIRYSSAMFVDEAGEPTGEVLEKGVARLRVETSTQGLIVGATVRSHHGGDVENVTLAETFPGSLVYEGTLQLSFVPSGSAIPQNGVLDAANSGMPEYLGDRLTLEYQDGRATAVTIPSRVRFVDGFGRVVSTFAVTERVGVRVEDHNLDNPLVRSTMTVLVHEADAGDSESITLTETGYDTNVYEGGLASENATANYGDGRLQVQPGDAIEAERLNQNTPYPTVARAAMAGSSVTFLDEQGRPAELYFERTRAFVRVINKAADYNSYADIVMVSLSSLLGLDSEEIALFETGGSTGVFEGSIYLSLSPASSNNGFLETGQYAGPPHEFDTLTARYESAAGIVTATAGTIGSRTWFLDAWGNLTDSYTAGTTAFVRVEDHVRGAMPGNYDTIQVTLEAPDTGDSETVTLRETTRDSGIFEGSLPLEKEDYPPVPAPGDGRLQSMAGEEIEVVHTGWDGNSSSSDTAVIRYSSAAFVDESGEPTGEVLEKGVARLRVTGSSPGSTVGASVRSLYGGDVENVTLAETYPGSQVYEGTLQLSFVPPGNATPQNGVLDASNSGMPEYLGDRLSLEYQDGRGTAVTIPSRVRFFDAFGRVTSTFAVGERVGVRVEDHNLDNPLVRSAMDVLVHEVGAGDSESITLTETGFDTNVYEGGLASENVLQNLGDGKLQVQPGRTIAAERLNQNTPYPTVSQAVMAGASIVFLDEQGRPADLYFERTRAYVRVTNKAADYNSYPDFVTVSLTSLLGGDGESLSLQETGGSTGVFEGSIGLSTNAASTSNGILETGQYAGPPHEFDTLTASYETAAGTVTATAGTIGARTWFLDAWGNDTDSYTAGTRAYVRVKAPNANAMPSVYDTVQVALSAPDTGDSETLTLRETARDSGVFEGSLPLEKEDYPPVPVPGDGRLQSLAGEEIEVVHTGWDGNSTSSDTAVIRFSSATFVDESGEPTGEVLEAGVARLRVTGSSPGSTVVASVRSLQGGDVENVTLAETSPGSQVYEGALQLSFVPPGNGTPQNGVLDASNSGMPEYLGDTLSVEYQDGRGTAVTVPSRVRFFDDYGRLTTTFAVGERVGVRVEDHNVDNPLVREQIQVTVREAGSADSEAVTLTETGFDTNVFEGGLASEDAPANFGDGKLQVQPGDAVEAERLNENSPYPTVGRAAMAGASVVFLDAQGQPAELYFERTRAYLRVTDKSADYNPYADMVTVFLSSMLALDGESLTLVETGGSTGVFEGSIPLSPTPPGSHNGTLETGQFSGPPHEFDTLTASYSTAAGTVLDTAGMIGSRIWFLDAWGNDVESYTAGTAAWLRVEDHAANSIDSYRDTIEVTVQAPDTGDSELVTLRETTWTSGIFEGSLPLEKEDYPPVPAPGDGRLQSMPGEEIAAVYQDYSGDAVATDSAVIRYSSATFVDEAGEPTGEVLEAGLARLRVTGSSPGPTVVASVRSLQGGDVENVTLAETSPGSQVYEGTVQLSFVPRGNAIPQNGVLDAANNGMPDYLGDQLTVEYQDGRGTAVTVPSRVRFFDAYGRLAAAFAAGERVGVRVEDHNDDDPLVKGQIQVLVREAGAGDSQTLTLTETGYDTNVYEGGLDTENAAAIPGDGRLQVLPGGTIEAERLNENSPYPTVARAAVAGSAVLFVDGQGRPAELYFERTRAWVRVIDEAADLTPLPETFSVSLTSLLAPDFEDLYLTETGGSTGVFEGSIPLSTNPASSFNGSLETGQRVGPPHEFDTLTVTYQSISDTAGTIGSRTWFVDSQRNPTDAYATGSSVSFLVEDHTASSVSQVTLRSLATGDVETRTVNEGILGSGIFDGYIELQTSSTPAPGDSRLQAVSGEEIEVTHTDWAGNSSSSDRAAIRQAGVEVFEDGQAEYGLVLENGVARIRVVDTSGVTGAGVTVRTRDGQDSENVLLSQTAVGWLEGTIQLAFVPRGGGIADNGTLETSNSGMPEYLQDEISVTYLDADGRAVTLPSRIGFLRFAEDQPATEYAVGSTIRVRVEDRNANDPAQVDTATALLSAAGDFESVTLTETAADSGIFLGELPSSDTPGAAQDGTLTAGLNSVAMVEHLNVHTPHPTRVPLPFNGNHAPQAGNDAVQTEQAPVVIAVLVNDTDRDQDPLGISWFWQGANGSVSIESDTLVYTPDPGFLGTDTFHYVANDSRGGESKGTVTVTVVQANRPPEAGGDMATVQEDGPPVAIDVLANDVDPDGDPLAVTILTPPAFGTAAVQPDRTVLFTPNPDAYGSDGFTYQIEDPDGATSSAQVLVGITGVNDPPAANDDTATAAEDDSATVTVLANDTDVENDALDVTAVTQGTNGSVVLNADDTVTYTPNANFHGTDSFTYTASDGNGGTDTATVTVTVTPVNDAPIANDDTAAVVEDGSVTVNVLGNDSDADNDTLTVTAVTQGANGTVTLNPVTYTPAPDFFGADSFTYTISDGSGGTDTATVTVTVAPSNDALTANDDSATLAEDGSATVAVLANDTDPENDVLAVQSVTQGTNGSVAINPDKTVTYTPNADFHGADSFTYTASDRIEGGGGIDSATVTVTVTPVNDAPVAGDDTASVVEDGSVAVTVLGNDADVDEDLLSVTSVTQGANGSVSVNPDDTVTYTPNANYNGTDSFTYTIGDGNGEEDTATVTVTVGAANDAPVAGDDTASTFEDNPVTVSVLGNDTDLENDTLSVSAVTQGANGAVAIVGSQVTYTPAANFNGTDSFTYTASDGNGGTATATVTVTVSAVNDAPVANDDPASVAEDGSVTVAVLANDTDAENDTLTVTAVTQGANGTVTLDPVTYTPNPNFHGADSFTYTIGDGNGGTDTATVNVTVGAANDAPVANDDTATVAEDGSVAVSVLGNDTDLDNDTLTVTAVTQGANGAVTLAPLTYTPNPNFFGSDSFTYTVSDGNGGTDTATVTVTVTAVNDAPVAVNDSASTLAETPVTIQVRTNDTDVDSATLTITAVIQGAHGTVAIEAGQTVTYTPAAEWIGPDTFTYTISDGAGGTATATVNVDVQAPPRVSGSLQVLYTFDEGSGTTVNDVSGVGTPLDLTVANASAVTWLPDALSIDSATLVQSAGAATKVIDACKSSNEVTAEAWVLPANLTQTGPAAIVTLSQNHVKRDVTLGQSGAAYNGQLRTSATNQGGAQLDAGGVATLDLTHVVYTRSSTGAVRIYVNGTEAAAGTLSGSLSTWASFNLALGGELSGTRYWTGDLHLVAIYSRALTATEVRQNFLAGAD